MLNNLGQRDVKIEGMINGQKNMNYINLNYSSDKQDAIVSYSNKLYWLHDYMMNEPHITKHLTF